MNTRFTHVGVTGVGVRNHPNGTPVDKAEQGEKSGEKVGKRQQTSDERFGAQICENNHKAHGHLTENFRMCNLFYHHPPPKVNFYLDRWALPSHRKGYDLGREGQRIHQAKTFPKPILGWVAIWSFLVVFTYLGTKSLVACRLTFSQIFAPIFLRCLASQTSFVSASVTGPAPTRADLPQPPPGGETGLQDKKTENCRFGDEVFEFEDKCGGCMRLRW